VVSLLTLGAIITVRPARSEVGTRLVLLAAAATAAFTAVEIVKFFVATFSYFNWIGSAGSFAFGMILFAFVCGRPPRRSSLRLSAFLGAVAVVLVGVAYSGAAGDGRGAIVVGIIERPIAYAAIALAIAASSF
jgi:peptidoglycan/LPS O-acetylase OafA/YrhL